MGKMGVRSSVIGLLFLKIHGRDSDAKMVFGSFDGKMSVKIVRTACGNGKNSVDRAKMLPSHGTFSAVFSRIDTPHGTRSVNSLN